MARASCRSLLLPVGVVFDSGYVGGCYLGGLRLWLSGLMADSNELEG